MRVTVVTGLPTAYRAPLYTRLNELLAAERGGLSVIFGGRTAPRVQWATPPETGTADVRFLRHGQLTIRGRTTYANPAVAVELRRTRPDVVVLGGYAPWIYAAAAWCRLTRTPYLVWSGETIHSANVDGGRERARRPIWRGAAGLLAYGPDAAEFLVAAGLDRGRVTVVGNGIDFDGFAAAVDARRPSADEFRRQHGISGPVVLAVGAKGLDVAEAAVQIRGDATLVVAGTADTGRDARRVDLGRVPADEMPTIFAAADALVHLTSVDRWPHAVNEALAAGLPVVASRYTGAPGSLFSGPGCAIVDLDAAAVAEALATATAVGAPHDPRVRDRLLAGARQWDVARMAERIVADAAHVRR